MKAEGGSQRFRRSDRLRSSKDFRRVSREGVRVASRSFVLLVSEQRELPAGDVPRARLGITVSRRVGNAVVRARVKRRIREWFRRNRERAPMARDIVVIARPTAADLASSDIARELGGALRRFAGANGS